MRRAVSWGLGLAVVLGGVIGLIAIFTARDEGSVAAREAAGPGELQPDRRRAHTADAAPLDPQNPVASGPHRAALLARDRRPVGADELLHALELGNVAILYGSARVPAALVELQESVAGRFDVELVAAGQMVVLARVAGLDDVVALAWRRVLRTDDPADPALREFAEAWLGKGA